MKCVGSALILPITHQNQTYTAMITWIIVFAVLALIFAVLGFGGIARGFASIAKIIFFIFLIVFIITFIMNMTGAGA